MHREWESSQRRMLGVWGEEKNNKFVPNREKSYL
jgi:hypothetical protein